MFYVSPEGGRYTIGRPFTYGGVQYTREGASHYTYMNLGFKQVLPQQRPNDAYYVVSGPNMDGSYSSTPRDLEQCKDRDKDKARAMVGSTLAQSDWMIIREMDTGVAMPPEKKEYRATVRVSCNEYEVAVDACTSIEELSALTYTIPNEQSSESGEVLPGTPSPE